MTNKKIRSTVGALVAATAAALLVAPATGMAAEKFGTSFQGDVDPIASPQACPGGAGEQCTRAPLYYDDPPHAGEVPFVPHDGTIDKIKVIADDPGSFRLQLVKLKNGFFPLAEVKVKAKGPRISYAGTGDVESFNVNVEAQEGWWLAQKARYTGALSCEGGPTNEGIVHPALAVNAPFADVDYYGGCTHLVQGVME
jgi:hypothetical protein